MTDCNCDLFEHPQYNHGELLWKFAEWKCPTHGSMRKDFVAIPESLTFDGTKGIKEEECPRCHRMVWLGEAPDGSKMCQQCYFEGMSDEELKNTI